MMRDAKAGNKTAQAFLDAALPYLDDAYAFAHFLMRNQADAEDAVQDCYLRALRQFDGFRGTAVRPWLLAILRTVCHANLVRQEAPGSLAYAPHDSRSIRQLVDDLPAPLGETIVLRECNGLSYHEIAEVTGVSVSTVMSRIAQARSLLLAARRAANKAAQAPPDGRATGGASRLTVYRANAC